ncbi:hypothetical protein C2R22_15050 [Salinigranum rubrum]|uniref:Uncharacterized protein n=1 Tax=Salinigranum rubrum TaxID=755307 RepID=A0A2I8VLI2_9EURY|nr:hypothetical protein [Salinigranum rubrum]AUV82793.1 hypothetical protein C2R22_15050 [Salinigranum rubrum]
MERTPFDDHLARLSGRERATFVGALLTARGWDVEVDPPVVRAARGDERRVVAIAREGLLPLPGRGLPRDSVDAVVGVDAERTRRLAEKRDARAWDANTVYEMIRYGLDPVTTDRLFHEHLGVGSETVGRPQSARTSETDTRDPKTGSPADAGPLDTTRPATASTVAAAVHAYQWVVPAVLLLGVVLVGGGLVAQAWADAPPADSNATATVDAAEDTTALPATSAATPEPRTVLPGLTAAGIDDTAVLARGHAAALENRSFTMHVTYTERIGNETVGTAREVVRVENETVYRSRGTQSGTFESDLVPVIDRDLYADGEGRYLQQGDGALRVGDADDPGTGQVVERSQALVTWYLSGDRSTLVDRVQRSNRVSYRITVVGTTDRRFEDYRATGLVSDEGLVVRVDATYRLPDSDRVATVSLRHERVGETTVERPDWMPPRNETAS